MQPPARAPPQGSGEKGSALGPDGLQVRVAIEPLAQGGLVLLSNIPHNFPLDATLAFFLADAAVWLEVVCQTLIAQVLPAWTLLEVVQDLLVEET